MSSERWNPDIAITDALAKQCVEEQFNELGPTISIKCVGEGWDNKVFLVNDNIIFRFPRRKIATELIECENIILNNIKSKFDLKLPEPKYLGKPSPLYPYSFHGYSMIKGRSASHAKLSMAERIASAKPLATFLKELHTITEKQAIEIGATIQPFDRTNTEKLISALTEVVSKVIARNICRVNETRFQAEMITARENELNMSDKALVHGDLYCRHLMFDHGKLVGIIDWGDTGINHPSVDLSVVFSFYPKCCHEEFFSVYGKVDQESLIHARFIGLYISLTILLYAHDIGDTLLFQEAHRSIVEINPNLIEGKNETQ